MTAIGIDLVEIDRLRRVIARRPGVAERIFTPHERELLARRADPVPSLAARFAAKEATMKALGVGIGGIAFADVEVRRLPSGAPQLHLSGRAAARAERLGLKQLAVSLSHTDATATAIVIAS